MTRIGLYCLDQDRETTSTLGIYNYTRNLIHHMVHQQCSGIELVLILSEQNKADMCPDRLPSWITVHVIKGRYGSGFRRIFADHVLACHCERMLRLDVMHYPKGWIPLIPNRRTRRIATIHDAIPFMLKKEYLGLLSQMKALYFCAMIRYSLHGADRIITISEYSRQILCSINQKQSSPVDVVYQGPGLNIVPGGTVPLEKRSDYLVMGSLLPHKTTRKTLMLLDDYVKTGKSVIKVNVTGISEWPPDWGRAPQYIQVKYLGRVSDTEMCNLLKTSRILFYLSRLEGFGLPAIEGYMAHTPVCYRCSTALAEVMSGVPGGWDGQCHESFCRAMNETLDLTDADVDRITEQLGEKFRWGRAAASILQIYKNVIYNNDNGGTGP